MGFLPTPPNGIGFRRRCANGYKAFGHAGRVRPLATLRERQALLTTRSEVTAFRGSPLWLAGYAEKRRAP
ncbi:MAG: hypothetical protein F6K56_24185 [Moorea sp. SIO3G5]|nr:hypothetical protein [Moorena sp. SIO3G5]